VNPANFKTLPKVDLHRHLDGSVRVATLRDLAVAGGFPLPSRSVRRLAPHCQVGRDCRSLADFLQKFFFFYDFLKSPWAVERIACEICEDAAADNVVYLETRFAPVLQATREFPMEDVVECALRGIRRGQKKFGVTVRLILCCYRSESPASSIRTVELARRYMGRGVVGVDFAGDEIRHPARPHYPAFRLAQKYDIPVTIHAGEAAGPDRVREAIERMGARRIGHGIHSVEDRRVLDLLRKHDITLEICPTSNVQTHVAKSYRAHPLKRLADAGIAVTVNSDDPGVSNITLTHEYRMAVRRTRGNHRDAGGEFTQRITIGARVEMVLIRLVHWGCSQTGSKIGEPLFIGST